jgi:hypothetical protein
MIKNILLIGLMLFMAVGFFVSSPSGLVSAQASLACDGLSPNQTGGDCTSAPDNAPAVDSVLSDALDFLSLVAGGIAVLMMIIAGVKFATSQGDSGKVTSAKNTVVYAIIGLLIAALAQTIIYFVLDNTINP